MQVRIQSLHFKASPVLEDFVKVKVEKLAHFSDHIISGDVCLKLDNSGTRDNKVCEIQLHVPGNNLFAKRQCKTFEEATSEAVDAIEEQLRKKKE